MSELKWPDGKQPRPRKVEINLGVTLNMGDFNSVRVDIRGDDTTRPNEEWGDAADRVYDEVERKLMEKVREAKQQLEG